MEVFVLSVYITNLFGLGGGGDPLEEVTVNSQDENS